MSASLDEASLGFLLDAPFSTATNFYVLLGDNASGFSYSSFDRDSYILRLDYGYQYTAVITNNTVYGNSTSANSGLGLYDRYGNLLALSIDYGTFSGLSFTATDTLYYLASLSSDSGFYTIRVENNTVSETNGIGEVIYSGVTYNAALDYTSDSDHYLFSAISGHTYAVSLTTLVPDLFLKISNVSTGLALDFLTSSGGVYTFTPSATGVYELSISSNSFSTTGLYSFIASEVVAAVNNLPTGSVTISGTATQGQTLTAANTLADADGLGTITYTWYASGSGTAIGSGDTYTLTQAEVGKTITVTASYTDGQGTPESKTSSATAAVANVNDLPTGSVTISGTVTQGQTLTAANTLADADGLGSITYTWYANSSGTLIGTGGTYTLTLAEVGKTITVTVSCTDGYGTPESKTSSATSSVANVNLKN